MRNILQITGTVMVTMGFFAVWIGCEAVAAPSVSAWSTVAIVSGLSLFVFGAFISGAFR